MKQNKRIAFILNPISGTGHKEKILSHLHSVFDNRLDYTPTFYTTKCAGDAFFAATNFKNENYDIVVAIGGDGTVNQVAKGLIGSNTKMGIIPVGSGNGLARHLKIPLFYQKAVETILAGNSQLIDAGKINDEIFFCTAGLGFEAVIGDRFNSAGSRGLLTYIEFCAKEYVRYRPEQYIIDINGDRYKRKAFLITFANCAQWGNNAFIAPDANISDGMLDMVIWKSAPLVSMPLLTAGLFLRTLQYSEFFDTFRCKSVKILREEGGLIQFDGESRKMEKEINISVIQHAVDVIVPLNIESSDLGLGLVTDLVPGIKEIFK